MWNTFKSVLAKIALPVLYNFVSAKWENWMEND